MVGVVGDHGEAGEAVHLPVLIHIGKDIDTTYATILIATVVTVDLGVQFRGIQTRNAVSILIRCF